MIRPARIFKLCPDRGVHCVWCRVCRMGIVLAIVLPPSHEETAITNLTVHLVPSDVGYVVVLFLWLQVMPCLQKVQQ
jgi:hypothetical protein